MFSDLRGLPRWPFALECAASSWTVPYRNAGDSGERNRSRTWRKGRPSVERRGEFLQHRYNGRTTAYDTGQSEPNCTGEQYNGRTTAYDTGQSERNCSAGEQSYRASGFHFAAGRKHPKRGERCVVRWERSGGL